MGGSAHAFTRRTHRRRWRVEEHFSHSGDSTRSRLSNPFLPVVLRRQTESAAGISGVGRIRQPHFAFWHTRRWNESAQLGFSPYPDDRRLGDRYRSSRRRKDNSRGVSRLDDNQWWRASGERETPRSDPGAVLSSARAAPAAGRRRELRNG